MEWDMSEISDISGPHLDRGGTLDRRAVSRISRAEFRSPGGRAAPPARRAPHHPMTPLGYMRLRERHGSARAAGRSRRRMGRTIDGRLTCTASRALVRFTGELHLPHSTRDLHVSDGSAVGKAEGW